MPRRAARAPGRAPPRSRPDRRGHRVRVRVGPRAGRGAVHLVAPAGAGAARGAAAARIRTSRWRRTGARGCTGSPCRCTGGWSRPNAAPSSEPGRGPRTIRACPAARSWCSRTGAAGWSRPTPRRSPLSAGAGGRCCRAAGSRRARPQATGRTWERCAARAPGAGRRDVGAAAAGIDAAAAASRRQVEQPDHGVVEPLGHHVRRVDDVGHPALQAGGERTDEAGPDGAVHVPRVRGEQRRALRRRVHPLASPQVGPRRGLERPHRLGRQHLAQVGAQAGAVERRRGHRRVAVGERVHRHPRAGRAPAGPARRPGAAAARAGRPARARRPPATAPGPRRCAARPGRRHRTAARRRSG